MSKHLLAQTTPATPKGRYALVLWMGLMGLSCLMWWRWQPDQATPHRQLPKAHKRCAHWIGVTGAWRHPGVICLAPLQRWRQQLRSAGPRCLLPATLRQPDHGERLHIPSATPGAPCNIKRLLLSPQERVVLRIPLWLNRENAAALAAIPGLRLSIAKKIVAYRQQHGDFRDIEELTKIRGIGPKTLERIRPYLRLKAPKAR